MQAQKEVLSIISAHMQKKEKPDYQLVTELINRNLLVQTEDGTYTAHSTAKTELMHSRMGALKEGFEKFAAPSRIKSIDCPKILDLCSGLSYNSLAALVTNHNSVIHMIEYSKELIYLGACLKSEFLEKQIIDTAIVDFFNNKENKKIKISCGDARQIIPRLPRSQYDVVFHDGFSPANDPVLYTVDFLKLLKSRMSSPAVLLSYSSSLPFRSSLLEAGFFIGRGPSIGRKRGITIAAVTSDDNRLHSRLTREEEKMIALTTVGFPYRDPKQEMTGQQINYAREIQRVEMRNSGKYLSAKQIKKNKIDQVYDLIARESPDSNTSIRLMNNYLLTNSRN